MKLGLCTSIDHLAEAAAAGFDFAELPAASLAIDTSAADFDVIRQRILAAPIRVEAFNVFLFGGFKVTGPAVDLAVVRAHMQIVLSRAAAVGASIMVFGSGSARSIPAGFPVARGWSQLAEAATLAAEIAQRHGLTIAMEPLCQGSCNFFNSVAEGVEFVERARHAHLRLLADLFHMTREQEPFANLVSAGKYLAHIHLPTPSLPETAKDIAYDFPAFFAALGQAGYRGRVTVEDNAQLFARSKLPLVDACRAVREYLAPYCQDLAP